MRESEIEAHLVDRVKALGGEVRKVRWIGRRGAPDRVVMMPAGKFVGDTYWIELKAPGKKPEPHQAREHRRMAAVGQQVYVLDSIESVDQFIRARGEA